MRQSTNLGWLDKFCTTNQQVYTDVQGTSGRQDLLCMCVAQEKLESILIIIVFAHQNMLM